MAIDSFLYAVEENTGNYPESKFLDYLRFDRRWALEFNNTYNYYRWLWSAINLMQPKNVVEIGTEFGAGAYVMLDSLPENAIFTTVDIEERKPNFLEEVQDSRVHRIIGNSLDVAAGIPNKIDFLFIDSDHEYDQVSKEWRLYKKKLTKNAIVVLDDIHFNEGMTKFWDEIDEEKYDISQWHVSGFGVIFKR